MKIIKILLIGIIFLFLCGYNTRIGNVLNSTNFKTVRIGNQLWMAENLNINKFRNGDIIPEAKTNEEWIQAGDKHKPVWCYYDNKLNNGKKYGKLYNWYAVNDKRGLAPKGWHIPSLSEFQSIGAVFNMEGNTLKAVGVGGGSNKSGFSALFAGYRDFTSGFFDIGNNASFWTSTQHNKDEAIVMSLNNSVEVKFTWVDKNFGFSIRCVND